MKRLRVKLPDYSAALEEQIKQPEILVSSIGLLFTITAIVTVTFTNIITIIVIFHDLLLFIATFAIVDIRGLFIE